MKKILAIGILTVALFACKSTSSTTSSSTSDSTSQSEQTKEVAAEETEKETSTKNELNEEMKKKIMALPLDKTQMKSIPMKKVEIK